MTLENPSQQVYSYRRYCLLERHAAKRRCEIGIANVFRAKQEEESATALPSGFPHAAELATGGYTTVQDINGADFDELECEAGLTQKQAQAVLTALGALL